MNTNQQEPSYNVHLRKAKKAINFILLLSLFSLSAILISERFTQSSFIQLTTIFGLFLSARYLFKYPFGAVVILGIFLLFYIYGWFNLLSQKFISSSSGIEDGYNMVFYVILVFRGIVTLVVMGGFYYATKGMIEKEQFEKKHGTLDEDEM